LFEEGRPYQPQHSQSAERGAVFVANEGKAADYDGEVKGVEAPVVAVREVAGASGASPQEKRGGGERQSNDDRRKGAISTTLRAIKRQIQFAVSSNY